EFDVVRQDVPREVHHLRRDAGDQVLDDAVLAIRPAQPSQVAGHVIVGEAAEDAGRVGARRTARIDRLLDEGAVDGEGVAVEPGVPPERAIVDQLYLHRRTQRGALDQL